ncbi:hypothetical protein CJU89_6270 [Yarrowia sp. B02]|nr:hypothetical protein CJU89_6270 [Yarrowia sp. B02]
MCILLATQGHPDYPLILLSNRDEYLSRPTAEAFFWDDNVLGPLDLAREEQGTWIGCNKQGKIAVILNYQEKRDKDAIGDISRGKFPKEFLLSSESPEEFVENFKKRYPEDKLQAAGGFSFLFGQVDLDGKTQFSILSNRGGDHEWIAKDADDQTIAISNSLFCDPWPKCGMGVERLDEAVKLNVEEGSSRKELVDSLFDVLSHDTFDPGAKKGASEQEIHHALRHSVFIPVIATAGYQKDKDWDVTHPFGKHYGTRTQTIIMVGKDGQMRYYEKTLHTKDTDEKEEHPLVEHVFEINKEPSKSTGGWKCLLS